jgi:cytochrome c oxidase assembly factor CtaG
MTGMRWTDVPLTASTAFTSWRWDLPTIVLAGAAAAGYLALYRRARAHATTVGPGRVATFLLVGALTWLLSGVSMVGVYSSTLFWVRALQTLLLLYLAPFGLASGKPVTVLRDALGPAGQARLDGALASRAARVLSFPLVPSLAILALPWLVFLTPWYPAVLEHAGVDAVTRVLMIAVGFCYFYSRLQADPVPHRYHQSISLLITVVESIADGVLGVVLWQGPLIVTGYYASVGRAWGPSIRTDQSIAAGVLWIVGDVLGLPFLMALMRAFSRDETRHAQLLDAQLDAAEPEEDTPPTTGLWWENEPQLAERFRRGG